MSEPPELTKSDRLAIDIDTRLASFWTTWLEAGTPFALAVDSDELIRDAVGAVVRTAYAQGYIDALREDKNGRRAELHRTHGYRPE